MKTQAELDRAAYLESVKDSQEGIDQRVVEDPFNDEFRSPT